MSMSLGDLDLTKALAETSTSTQRSKADGEESCRISDENKGQLGVKADENGGTTKKKLIKVMLLGQSEAGKSALLKNIQRTHASQEWCRERAAWRSVIFLNLVRNVSDILRELSKETDLASAQSGTDELDLHQPGSPSMSDKKYRLLQLRLAPLRGIQTELEQQLGPAITEPRFTEVTTATPFVDRPALQEFSINSTNGWRSALEKFRNARLTQAAPGCLRAVRSRDDERAEVLATYREDMKLLWEDPFVREMLSKRKIPIDDSASFFLPDVERIAVRDYQPTDDDIIRARLRTLGAQEHRFIFEQGRTAGYEWRFYDVGGTRSSRAAWYPYFDDLDAIIFLAPISCFDEKLAEDRRINRLEDSYLLWKSLCSSKILAKTQIVLMLNKCDLLFAKLQRGIRIRDHVPSFGERNNNLATVTRYFQQHFKEIAKQFSPVQRTFYAHLTSVIDQTSTTVAFGAVEESVLRNHLRRTELV
ncbi:guanine nucleotide binding protein, alpha subunit [Mycena floridula]|nr:guanine nucleotide binding protein, alpha subunit [Mycena floridula]